MIMSARYLIRLDDACDTMKLNNWELIEKIFDKYSIKPIIAVIPNNKDESLKYEKSDSFFWKKIKQWHEKQWTIAMHGYEHILETTESKSLLPFYKRSEFTGQSVKSQKEKILGSLDLFQKNGINPRVFVAPAHTFDINTLTCLKEMTNIRIISDGLATNMFFYMDFYWIPVQIWNFIKLPFGLWTLCLHPNTMSLDQISDLEHIIAKNYKNFVSLQDLKLLKRKKSIFDHCFNYFYWIRRRLKFLIT